MMLKKDLNGNNIITICEQWLVDPLFKLMKAKFGSNFETEFSYCIW